MGRPPCEPSVCLTVTIASLWATFPKLVLSCTYLIQLPGIPAALRVNTSCRLWNRKGKQCLNTCGMCWWETTLYCRHQSCSSIKSGMLRTIRGSGEIEVSLERSKLPWCTYIHTYMYACIHTYTHISWSRRKTTFLDLYRQRRKPLQSGYNQHFSVAVITQCALWNHKLQRFGALLKQHIDFTHCWGGNCVTRYCSETICKASFTQYLVR